jgi:hypothetical protein
MSLFWIVVTVGFAAKNTFTVADALSGWQVDAALQTLHHVFGLALFFFWNFSAVSLNQQINQRGDGKQKYQTTHINSIALTGRDALFMLA